MQDNFLARLRRIIAGKKQANLFIKNIKSKNRHISHRERSNIIWRF